MHAVADFSVARDPRVDPQPGDQLERHGATIKVFAASLVEFKGRFIEYHVLPHDQAVAPFIEQVSLETFRRFAARWTV